MAAIPEDIDLNHRQRLQVEGVRNGASYIDKEAITAFISNWQYPLYFLDFETIFPTIPVLNGTRPYQQVPFQYSLHIVTGPDAPLQHKEFLVDPKDFNDASTTDPRRRLLAQLKYDMGNVGNIVAYNAPFELGVLKNLALAFPEEAPFLEDLISRFVDLLIVFRNAWYYKPEMGASASIKSVLPAIDKSFSYTNLDIKDGGSASSRFLSMIKGTLTSDELEDRSKLLEYCKRDTEGMVIIWKELMKQTGG